MQCEWAFLQRVMPGISGFFEGVEAAVSGVFFTSLFGDQITSTTRSWSSAPIKMGRMAIPKPDEDADLNHQTSVCQTAHLKECLKGRAKLDHVYHNQLMTSVRAESKDRKRSASEENLHRVKVSLPKLEARKLDYLQEQ